MKLTEIKCPQDVYQFIDENIEFGLTAKYGNNFAGGKVRGKFKLIFEFR